MPWLDSLVILYGCECHGSSRSFLFVLAGSHFGVCFFWRKGPLPIVTHDHIKVGIGNSHLRENGKSGLEIVSQPLASP